MTQKQAQEQAMNRANRVSVLADSDGFVATFYRTHKTVGEVRSADLTWESKGYANKTAEREAFRQYVCDNAASVGIAWDPTDNRTEENLRRATYPTDADLIADAIAMVTPDVTAYLLKSPYADKVGMLSVTVDGLTPITETTKGYDLAKAGILDGKYVKNGYWAWAKVPMTVTMQAGEQEIYLPLDVELVSGQLRKPKLTQTSINDHLKADLLELGLIPKEEPKAAKAPAQEPATETPAPKAKGKGNKSKSKTESTESDPS